MYSVGYSVFKLGKHSDWHNGAHSYYCQVVLSLLYTVVRCFMHIQCYLYDCVMYVCMAVLVYPSSLFAL